MPNNIAAYRISVRSKKWWWPLFDYLLDVAMQNAWLIYRQTAGAVQQSLDQLDFRLSACSVYYARFTTDRPSVGRALCRPKTLSLRVLLELRLNGANHYIVFGGTQRWCAM